MVGNPLTDARDSGAGGAAVLVGKGFAPFDPQSGLT